MSESQSSRSIKIVTGLAAVGLLTLASFGSARSDEIFHQTDSVLIPGLIAFDISWVDPTVGSKGLYFLADRSNKTIDTIDVATHVHSTVGTGLFAGTGAGSVCTAAGQSANDCAGPDGLLTLNNNGTVQIWVGDFPSRVWVLTLTGTQVVPPILTGGLRRADELCFDPTDHVVMIANDAESDVGAAPFVSFIPTQGPHAYTVVKKIEFPDATNGIEQCQWNPRTGLIYLNLPEVKGPGDDSKNGNVVVIDPVKMEVVKRFVIPVARCAGPQGMAIGPKPEILLGCNAGGPPHTTGTQNAAVIDEKTGAILFVLDNLGGADQVWFNPGDGHYALAGGSHLPNEQLGIVDSINGQVDQIVDVGNAGGTTRRAHSVAADPKLNQIFLPVPKIGGGTPGFTSNLMCDACVAVFAPIGKDDTPPTAFVRHPGGEE